MVAPSDFWATRPSRSAWHRHRGRRSLLRLAMRRLAEDSCLRKALAGAGHRLWARRFTLRAWIAGYRRTIARALASPPPDASSRERPPAHFFRDGTEHALRLMAESAAPAARIDGPIPPGMHAETPRESHDRTQPCSPDAARLAAILRASALRFWNLATGSPVSNRRGRTGHRRACRPHRADEGTSIRTLRLSALHLPPGARGLIAIRRGAGRHWQSVG